MKHARQTIREAAVAMLAGIIGVTFARSRVYNQTTLPAISVYTDDESIRGEPKDSLNAPRRYGRYVNLVIEFATEAVTNFEDTADDYAARIEAAIAADLTLTGTATDVELAGTTTHVEEREAQPLGITRLNFIVWYRTTAIDPENAIV